MQPKVTKPKKRQQVVEGVVKKSKKSEQKVKIEEEEEVDSEEETEPKGTSFTKLSPRLKRKMEEDDDESEDDDSEDAEDEEAETVEIVNNKRKKSSPAIHVVPPKKIKTEEIASIFLGGLERTTSHASIKEFFKKHDVTVTDVRKKVGKRFGHCDLGSMADLARAVKLTKYEIDGAAVEIAAATGPRPAFNKKFKKVGKKTLVVRNLNFKITEKDLLTAFEKSIAARIPTFTDTGKPRGKGFVDFEDVESAKAALEALNGAKLEGRKIFVEFAPETGMKKTTEGDLEPKVKRVKKEKKKEFSENKFEDDSD